MALTATNLYSVLYRVGKGDPVRTTVQAASPAQFDKIIGANLSVTASQVSVVSYEQIACDGNLHS
jgi:hypothetical protein